MALADQILHKKAVQELVTDSMFLLVISYFILYFSGNKGGLVAMPLFFKEVFLVGLLAETIFYTQDMLYQEEVTENIKDFFLGMGVLLVLSEITIITLYFYPPYQEVIRYFLSDNRLPQIAMLLLVITAVQKTPAASLLTGTYGPKRVLVLGEGSLAQTTIKEINKSKWPKYKVMGLVEAHIEEGREYVRWVEGKNTRNREKTGLSPLARQLSIDKIVVASVERRGRFPTEELLKCKMQGVDILEAQDIYEELTGKIHVKNLRPSWLIFTRGFRKHPLTMTIKNTIDFSLAVGGLILCAPLMLITAIVIKLDSPGAVLFRQKRVGQWGDTFTLFKFRTMYENAEHGCGPVWAQKNDSRITRTGKIIRQLRLDELPQMLNVLKGEMSFVGPRPERPYFVDKLQHVIPYYTQRLTVKPGITGWAAVNYQYAASVDDATEKLQYDLYYIKNMSVPLDIYIALKTFYVMLTGKGSR